MAGLGYALGRGFQSLGAQAQANEEMNLKRQELQGRQALEAAQAHNLELQGKLNELQFNVWQKYPEALLPSEMQQRLWQHQDNLQSASWAYQNGLSEKDPQKREAWGMVARAYEANADPKMIEGIMERYNLVGKPGKGIVTQAPGGGWQVESDQPGPLSGTPQGVVEKREAQEGKSSLNLPISDPKWKGANFITPNGDPWPDPTMSASDVFKNGGALITDKGKDALNQAQVAESGFDDMIAQGKKVLAEGPGMGAAVNPYVRGAKFAFGSVDVAAYNATKINLINHLRAVAGVARVNQAELQTVNDALANAHTYPQLVAAIGVAKQHLERWKRLALRSGQLNRPDGSIVMPSSAPVPNRMYKGQPYATRKGPSGWEYYNTQTGQWAAWPP